MTVDQRNLIKNLMKEMKKAMNMSPPMTKDLGDEELEVTGGGCGYETEPRMVAMNVENVEAKMVETVDLEE